MNRSFLILLIVLTGTGIALGITLGARSDDPAATESAAQWVPQSLPTDYSVSKDRFLQELFASKLFPAPYADQSAAPSEEGTNEDEPDQAAFPPILSAAKIDGEFKLQIRMPDGTLLNAGANDTLPGEWIVREITLDKVVAEQDGRIEVFDLTASEPPA